VERRVFDGLKAGVVTGILVAAVLLGGAEAEAPTTAQRSFSHGTEFAATDPREQIEYALGRDLVIRAHREQNAQGVHTGWWLEAVDRRLPDSPNFLYDCLCGHGPHPTQLEAWHLLRPEVVANIGPLSERILPVCGYPYELRVRCVGCAAEGDDATAAHFTNGTIEVTWRLLRQSNARQKSSLTLGDEPSNNWYLRDHDRTF
jgi:hypothetical protein